MKFAKPHKKLFLKVMFITLVSSYVALVTPYLLKLFFDEALIKKDMKLFYFVTTALLATYLVNKFLSVKQATMTTKFSQRINTDVKEFFFKKICSMDQKFLHDKKTGDTISRFESDSSSVLGLINIVFTSGAISLLRAIGIMVISLMLSWEITLIALIAFPVYFYSEKHFTQKIKLKRKEIIKKSSEIVSFLHEKIPTIKTIQLFNRQKSETKEFVKKNEKKNLVNLDLVNITNLSGIFGGLILYLPSYLVLALGGYKVIAGTLTIGSLIALRSYLQELFGPLSTLSNIYKEIELNSVSLDRVFEVFQKKPRIRNSKTPIRIKRFEGEIVFDNVGFHYERDMPILKDISFTISKGETIGVMGCSGEGKSTINDLICRFYDPKKGRILIDGHDLKKINLEDLRNEIGVVSQDSVLNDLSVKQNILFGKQRANMKEIISASKSANSHDFIMNLPKQYNTNIKESGKRLSGGQKQRLAIARVILKDPSIVILDEATSALDPESEVRVRELVKREFKDKTCIIISHRISTLLDCDRIIILQSGSIVESGSWEELLANQGVFRKFYEYQRKPVKNFLS